MRSLTLLLLVALVLCIATVDGGRGWRRKNRCPRPRLENGIARVRSRGRVVRYRCYRGFTLYPTRFNTCVRRQWIEPHAVCVKTGCPATADIAHGQKSLLLKGGIVSFKCQPGFELEGHAVMYCNGRHWNGTEPTCQPAGGAEFNSQVECDFETDLCGWTHGEAAEFQWTKHSGRTPSSDMFTGPSHDHTLGDRQQGKYMYIEASDPRVENDTARLFSPVYAAGQSVNACFSLWYHMWGSSLGAIRVYILPVDRSLDQLDGPDWERTHNMGNRWINKIVPVPEQTSHFQVVIEGMRGENYMSDAAIDDVALKHGDECIPPTQPPLLPTASSQAPADEAHSCRGRCGESRDPALFCRCTDDCQLDGGCCDDYYRVCLEEEGEADDNSTVADDETTTSAPVTTVSESQSTAAPAAPVTVPTTPSSTTTAPTTQPATAPTTTTSTTTTTTVATTQPTTTTTTTTTTPTTIIRSTTTTIRTTTPTTTPPTTTTTTTEPPTRPPTTMPTTRQTQGPTTTVATTTPTTPSTTTTTTTTTTTATTTTQPPQTTTISQPSTTAAKSTTTASTTTPSPPSTSTSTPSTSTPKPPGTHPRPSTTYAAPPTTTEMSNELPFPVRDDASNALPRHSGQTSAVTSRSHAGLPMYAIAAIACGVLLVAAVLSVLAGRRYCRPRPAGRLDDDNDSLVFFAVYG